MGRGAKVVLLALPIGIGLAIASSSSSSGGGGPTPNGTKPAGGGGGNGGSGGKGSHIPGWPPPEPRPLPPGRWIDQLAEEYSLDRERQIYDAIAAGYHNPIVWYAVQSPGAGKYAGWTLEIPVMADALMIDGVRVTPSFPTTQAIADKLGARLAGKSLLMMTPYVAGLVWQQADARLSPTTSNQLDPLAEPRRPENSSWNRKGQVTATTSQMVAASRAVDAKLHPVKLPRDEQGLSTLVANAGKDWVITAKYAEPGKHPDSGVPHKESGANHGLYTADWSPIQNVGVFHELGHTDYSQTARYFGPTSILRAPDGTSTAVDNASAIQDPELAPFLTGVKGRAYVRQAGEGALPYARHPLLVRGTMV